MDHPAQTKVWTIDATHERRSIVGQQRTKISALSGAINLNRCNISCDTTTLHATLGLLIERFEWHPSPSLMPAPKVSASLHPSSTVSDHISPANLISPNCNCSPRPAAVEGRKEERHGRRLGSSCVGVPGVGLLSLPRAARIAALPTCYGDVPRLGDGGTAVETVGGPWRH